MGYGEFVGGGSVKWNITHTHGDHGGGGQQGGNGRDKDPTPNSGAVFTIQVINRRTNSTEFLGPWVVDDSTIKVEWAPRTGVTTTIGKTTKPATKSKRAKTAARKSYKSAQT